MKAHEQVKKLALKLASQAGEIQRKKWGSKLNVRWKALTNPVTEVDQACEELVFKSVSKHFPEHAQLGEETGSHGKQGAEYLWIVDPLDGTVNYSHGLPQFSVSIGVYYQNKPWLGIVYAPILNELFVAEAGKGAFLNGKKIQISKQSKPLESLLVSGFSYHAKDSGENVREWLHFLKNAQAIRRLGCASLDYCWTAAGRFEGFWEFGLGAWDSAAGELMVREAGGKVTNLEGRPYSIFKPGVLATNGKIHAHCLRVLREAGSLKIQWPLE